MLKVIEGNRRPDPVKRRNDILEQEWNEKLRRMDEGEYVELTPEEIAFIIQKAENFKGKHFKMKKYNTWVQIKELAEKLRDMGEAKKVELIEPRKSNASACVMIKGVKLMLFIGKRKKAFEQMVALADSIYIAVVDGGGQILNISFIVRDVWEE